MWSENDMNEKMNKVHCVDCLDFMRTIPNDYFDIVVTDPPYGMNFVSNHRAVKHKSIIGDDSLEWLCDFMCELDRIAKEEAHIYIFCSWHNVDVFKQCIEKYRDVKNILIWEKNNTGMGDLYGDYAPKYEMIFFCSNGERELNGSRDPNIIKSNRTNNELHPTQKPVELITYLLEKSSRIGDKVFDPFLGSGTTAIACKSLGLDWCGCEIDEEYVEIANRRLKGVQTSIFKYLKD